MTKGRQIPNRDLERLSAYLDGALTAKEASRLEARLREEPILQQALLDLKGTAQLVASLSEVPLPRNFTLTPEMVSIRERPRVYPVMRLATALATFAFLLVIGVDAISGFALKGALAPLAKEQVAMEAPAPTVYAIVTREVSAEGPEVEEPKLGQVEQEEAVASEPLEIPGGTEGELDRAAPTRMLGVTNETESFAAGGETTGAPELIGTPTPVASGTTTAEEAAEAEATESGFPPTFGIQPTPHPMLTATYTPSRVAVQPEPVPVLRLAEFGLGALAILLAGLTFWISRKNQ
jgi:hypothetical protein